MLQGIPEETLDELVQRLAIHRACTMEDVQNVIDFFLSPRSDFVTGQIVYLGGVW
jgi:3-oxoacyl-[acyl-carrier protein] reductase